MSTLFITGTSTGIGRALTLAFAAQGHTVFAGVRRDTDAQSYEGTANVRPLLLDVRHPESVQAAVEHLAARGQGLDGLVNNAGVGGIGPLSVFTVEELQAVFDVNLLGVHRVTQACLPLLLQSRGRIVHIGSQGGMISSTYFGPYTASKHALEAYTIALRGEVEPHGLRVSIVQPGGIVSAIDDNTREANVDRFRRARPPFDQDAQIMISALEDDTEPDPSQPESATNRIPSSPDIVTEAVADALFAQKPRPSYLVGTPWEGDRVARALLSRLAEINRAPSMGRSPEELHALLDEHLRGAKR